MMFFLIEKLRTFEKGTYNREGYIFYLKEQFQIAQQNVRKFKSKDVQSRLDNT